MENNKNKKSVKFQGDMLNFCDFIQVFVFTRNHHLNCSQLLIYDIFRGKQVHIHIMLASFEVSGLSWTVFHRISLHVLFFSFYSELFYSSIYPDIQLFIFFYTILFS